MTAAWGALLFTLGLVTGTTVTLALTAQQLGKRRDRAALNSHLAMVRAMRSMSTPHQDNR